MFSKSFFWSHLPLRSYQSGIFKKCEFLCLKKFEASHDSQIFLFHDHDFVNLPESNEYMQKSFENVFQTSKRWTRKFIFFWKSVFGKEIRANGFKKGLLKAILSNVLSSEKSFQMTYLYCPNKKSLRFMRPFKPFSDKKTQNVSFSTKW